MNCPDCQEECRVVETAYGERANCGPCGVRWTRIRTKGHLHIEGEPSKTITYLAAWTKERR